MSNPSSAGRAVQPEQGCELLVLGSQALLKFTQPELSTQIRSKIKIKGFWNEKKSPEMFFMLNQGDLIAVSAPEVLGSAGQF